MNWEVWISNGLNALLLFILVLIAKPIISYFAGILKEVKGYRDETTKLRQLLERAKIEELRGDVFKVYTAIESLREELTELQRSVDGGAMDLRAWQASAEKVMGKYGWTSHQVEKMARAAKIASQIFRQQGTQINVNKTEIRRLKGDIIIIKDKKK